MEEGCSAGHASTRPLNPISVTPGSKRKDIGQGDRSREQRGQKCEEGLEKQVGIRAHRAS